MFENIIYLILVIMVLVGINLMSKPETAVMGNRLSALSMLLSVIYTLISYDIVGSWGVWLGIAIGGIIGIIMSVKVKMIQMPETVAVLNAFGGLASALVATVSTTIVSPKFELMTGILAILIGNITFIGSMIAAGKLAKVLNQRPVVYKFTNPSQYICYIIWVLVFILAWRGSISWTVVWIISFITSAVWGFTFAQRVGGADMPIVISLLNSTSGVAGSISGMAINNALLVAVGAIVGASGLILTQIMCKSMNRSLKDILLGIPNKISKPKDAKKTEKIDKKEEKVEEKKEVAKKKGLGIDYNNIKKVMIVPGYGMALSQAQAKVKELMEAFEGRGAEVVFGIHSVAGRMPGHMNVLLAEVGIDYSKFHEMNRANEELKETDLVIAIGANDVVNPAANTAEGTPIYGMPVLDISQAKQAVICNFDTKPGYSGVENPMYSDGETKLILGDAKDSIDKILEDMKNSGKAKEEKPSEKKGLGIDYENAKKVMIVPGYGMALSQAQAKVKELMEAFEGRGAEVVFGIHSVAGRMPGHMNVLLAEVGIDYSKFHEMNRANEELKDTDLVIAIGANDVVNPAANTAEGTPIYGMPVLDISQAKQAVICNFDTKPGYSGVENPMYSDGETKLILGDAKDSIDKILEDMREYGGEGGSDEEKKEVTGLGIDYENVKKVMIVPGYGMALSQAQAKVKELMEAFEGRGAEVVFGIHSVAGRMPGHMNVLLAEVGIDYSKFHEMNRANEELKDTDLVIAIGANDVVNPAANTAEGTPIYGMPVLDISQAKQAVICNFDTKPGYSGVENPMYSDGETKLILGDAKDSIDKILEDMKNSGKAKEEKPSEKKGLGIDYENAKKVMIVPGYGMALSQAQAKVKELMEAFEGRGAEVVFGIHSVAGRMPGHMNVLLAEVGIDYSKFHEMNRANEELKDTDLVIAIGANDVVNPAANTAEGTPIYGMPVLDISQAKQAVICNFDTKPGYSGVENPMYEDGETILILGDAKDSIDKILKDMREN